MINQLVTLRKNKGFSQRDFAKLLGVSNCCIARIETHERRVDVIEMIDYLRALQLTDQEIVDFLTVTVKQH